MEEKIKKLNEKIDFLQSRLASLSRKEIIKLDEYLDLHKKLMKSYWENEEEKIIYQEEYPTFFLTIKKIKKPKICAISGCKKMGFYEHELGDDRDGVCFITCKEHIQRGTKGEGIE